MICANCGEPILDNPTDPEDACDDEHVVAKQFFPKAMRSGLREPLWVVPSHRRCNQSNKLNEEYFFHYFFPLVAAQNEPMGQALLADLKRRAKEQQSRGLIRRMLKEMTNTSLGGIILPSNLIRVNFDLARIQNVAVKVAKCLFYRDNGRYLPESGCVHVELCETSENVQPFFVDLCCVPELERRSADPSIFRYWYVDLDGRHYYALLFWDAFMFCLIFQDPAAKITARSA
jgi:hypothetical protein